MSTLEKIRAAPFANTAAVIEHCRELILAGNAGSAAEKKAVEMIIDCLVAAVHKIWVAAPLEIELAWPSGLHKHTRQTLRAQLQKELDQVAVKRAQEEFRHVLLVAPELANAFSAWCIALSK